MSAFAAPKRFEIVRRLGEGGMGVVYEALDRERNARVALKTVRTMGAEALARFKGEFRALQDVHHPNLVSLGELIAEGDQWFFSMELVVGADLLEYVRAGGGSRPDSDSIAPASVGFASTKRLPAAVVRADAESAPGFDEIRLRASFAQLASALAALHAASKVHRDVKPSNVRVTPEGRVVLLDFGLVTELDDRQLSTGMHVVGTPDYMAPEQAASKAVGPEADWYSFGVVLYQALTGTLPFAGAPLEVLLAKQKADGPSPRDRSPSVPYDLDELATALLRFDPHARPSGSDVLRRLGAGAVGPGTSRSHTQNVPFVGRADELEALRGAMATSAESAVAVLVQGESGVGKSCLVRRFLDATLVEDPSVVVLAGRCYERELVPYKAFDGVTDALARYLKRLPRDEVTPLVPTRPAALLQVFPVLRRVRAFADVAGPAEALKMDLLEQRSRAFTSLRDLLTRLGDRRRVLVVIDDLQWADAESFALLAEVLRPPEAPPLLLIGTVRTSDTPATGPTLFQRLAGIPANVHAIDLARLPPEQSEELAALLLQRSAPDAPVTPRTIAAEAGGHPLFIDALVRHATLGDGPASVGGAPRAIRLDEALWAQIARLEPLARELMEILAIAGAPIVQEVLASAADAERGTFAKSVSFLRVAHLVSITGGRGSDTIEPYHDKVRAAVVANLDDARKRECHRKLAAALDALGDADAESLAVHWSGAGEPARAARYAERAADESAEALAFDHAAALYELALVVPPKDKEAHRALREKLGDSFAKAGRGAQAATAYRKAAEGATAALALDLRRRAADQLLRGGHFDDGLFASAEVLASIGLRLPKTPFAALCHVILWSLYLRVRGFGFKRRDPSEIPASDLTRADVCWSIAFGLSFTDHMRGAAFGARYLALALRLGEPKRIARALALQIGYVGAGGSRTWKQTERLMALATEVAASTEDPQVIAFVATAKGLGHYLACDFRPAYPHLVFARETLATSCTNVAWEIDTAVFLEVAVLFWSGRFQELIARMPKSLREATDRGDLYASVTLRTSESGFFWLLLDRPDEARRQVSEALGDCSMSGYHVEHFRATWTLLMTDLYQRRPLEALRRYEADEGPIRRSLFLRVEVMRLATMLWRAVVGLAIAEDVPERRAEGLQRCRRAITALRRERAPIAAGIASLYQGGLDAIEGRRAAAAEQLRAANPILEAADYAVLAVIARRFLGLVVGGDEGKAMTAGAEAWMRDQGVVAPAKFARAWLPGESLLCAQVPSS
jgi:hypothetical protein